MCFLWLTLSKPSHRVECLRVCNFLGHVSLFYPRHKQVSYNFLNWRQYSMTEEKSTNGCIEGRGFVMKKIENYLRSVF